MANVGLGYSGGSRDLEHVAHVGAATSPQNLNMWEPSPDIGQLNTQLGRIAVVQFFGFVKFRMAAA